jgi:hypothetical protein
MTAFVFDVVILSEASQRSAGAESKDLRSAGAIHNANTFSAGDSHA